jgi:hypothetical protein
MSANDKISNLVSTQVPFFVRNDHENFVKFVEAYYEYLEQQGKTIHRAKTIKDMHDVDQAVDEFADKLYDYYLKLIPSNIVADKNIVLKHVKDFYTARGTEKSIVFLLNILFGNSNVSFYYPKQDILRASDGKWFIEKSLKIEDAVVKDTAAEYANNITLKSFAGKRIFGATSNAEAIVESVEIYYENGFLVKELKISNQIRDFISGERIIANTTYEGQTYTLTANIISGIVVAADVIRGGNNYSVGMQVPLESNTGNGGIVVVSSVTSGSLLSVEVVDGGAGFQQGDRVIFTSDSGVGANANVATVNFSGTYHPNSYNISLDTIELEKGTQIGNLTYGNLNSTILNPATANTIANTLTYWHYANTGPASAVFLIDTGTGFRKVPTANVSGNLRIKQLGILGKMNIVSRGSGYANGEIIEFINGPESYGVGAKANILSVNATGAIMEVRFVPVPGQMIGGTGYNINRLPRANIITAAGSNGQVVVTTLLGYGDILNPSTDSIGKILSFRIDFGGSGYSYPPTINLTSLGDGTAQAISTIVTGIYTYPGRYLNDDGHVSGYNFIQDRDFYHNYSYVVKIKESIEKYRKALKDLVHPSGTKLFGEYDYLDDNVLNERGVVTENVTKQYLIYDGASYQVNNSLYGGNTLTISLNTAGLSVGSNLLIEFASGNIKSLYNPTATYRVKHVINANAVIVFTSPYIPARSNLATFYGSSSVYNLQIDPVGSHLFFGRSTSVNMFTFKSPWDISTLEYVGNFDFTDKETGNRTVSFSANGDYMYTGGTGNTIHQFALPNKWSINGASFVTNSAIRTITTGENFSSLSAITFNKDGKIMYVADDNNDVIFQYNLATPWFVNTASYVKKSANTGFNRIRGLVFNANGSILYSAGSSTDTIRMYRLSESWNVNTIVFIGASLATSSINVAYDGLAGLAIKPDGNVFYTSDRNSTYTLLQLPTTVSGNAANIVFALSDVGTVNVGKLVI